VASGAASGAALAAPARERTSRCSAREARPLARRSSAVSKATTLRRVAGPKAPSATVS
jgi:hypothetical protein